MLLIHRSQFIICFLLAAVLTLPISSPTNAQGVGPSLAAASMATSPFGTVTVAGDGFTPGGLVRVVIQDLWGVGPTVDFWVVTSAGAIDAQLPYLATATYGPQGSQDPAQGYTVGTVLPGLVSDPIYGTNGSQDPAQGYIEPDMGWSGGCPDLMVRSWDARSDTWSNTLDVTLAGC